MSWHARLHRRRRAFVNYRRNGGDLGYRYFCVVWRDPISSGGGGGGERLAA